MSVTHESVEAALKAFVEPETLEGDNQVIKTCFVVLVFFSLIFFCFISEQYFCEKCNEKQDAQKVCVLDYRTPHPHL